ncbi:MAG: SigE family RNA polymerase sigma factor [Acidimicrobiia bacterium]|nr:MAG: SigE family RNA polymerase sigma factor [Acidimicrobiia bacterium]
MDRCFQGLYNKVLMEAQLAASYSAFVSEGGARLRRAFIAAYGPEVGSEATSDALVYAWEHWDRIVTMENPTGYLYRVGQSKARRYRRRHVRLPVAEAASQPWFEPGLPSALERLSERQRQAILLCHGYGWTLVEVGDLLGIGASTVQRHIDRGMAKLRSRLGVDDL